MPSAKIYYLPRTARRRPIASEPPRYAVRPNSRAGVSRFGQLLMVTLLGAFLYLTGAANVARHDALYAALLAAAWGFYFFHDRLLRTRLGPLLMLAGQLLPPAAAVSFFGFVLWLVLSHP